MESPLRTQRITAVDIGAGRIRVPHETKSVFPSDRQEVPIRLRGVSMTVPYDPEWALTGSGPASSTSAGVWPT
jgi:hypothetical protein